MKNALIATVVTALVAAGTASAGLPKQHAAGYWNKNVCKPLYLQASITSPALANEPCTRDATVHVYVNGHSQILSATLYHNTATFYGNGCVVRIRSANGQQRVSVATTSYRMAQIRVRFTPAWQHG